MFASDFRRLVTSLGRFGLATPAAFVSVGAAGLGLMVAAGTTASLSRGAVPFRAPAELSVLSAAYPEKDIDWMLTSYAMASRISDSPVYTETAFASLPRGVVVSNGKMSRSYLAEFVSSDYLSILGIPVDGTATFYSQDTAMVSRDLARTFFGTTDAIGESLLLDGAPFDVSGLLPPEFEGFDWQKTDLLLPLDAARTLLSPDHLDNPEIQWLTPIVRRHENTSLETETRELDRVAEQLRSEFPGAQAGLHLRTTPLIEHYYGPDLRRAVLYVSLCAGALLLLCFANVGNIILAAALGQTREISTQRVLGASSLRIYRICFDPLLVTTSAGLILAAAAARPASSYLMQLSEIPPASARVDPLAPPVLLGVGGIIIVLTLLLGLIPLSQARSKRIAENLRKTKGASRGGRRLRSALIVLEVAMALVLCLGAGVLIRSLNAIGQLDVGMDTRGLSATRLQLVGEQYDAPGAKARFARELAERIESSGSFAKSSFGGRRLAPLALFGATALRESDIEDEEGVLVLRHSVGSGFLETLGVQLIEGRLIDASDRADGVPSVVISEAASEALWPGESALGKRFRLEPKVPGDPMWTVIGVVSDVEARGPRTPIPNHDVYFPFEQLEERDFYMVMRSRVGLGAQEREIHQMLRELDSTLPLHPVESMRKRFADRAADERFATVITSIFSGIALILAAVGIFGVMNLSVSQRVQELGVRLALGARPRALLGSVVLRAMALAAAGIALGLVISFFLRKLLSGFLYGVGPFDPVATLGAVAMLFLVAVLASLLPARRAMQVDPVIAIKNQ